MERDGWVDRWMDGGGGSIGNNYRCKPLGPSPVRLPSRWEIHTSCQTNAGTDCLCKQPVTVVKIIRRSMACLKKEGKKK